jgi:3-oxoacyl-[acyl-carrier-protein] synthase-3
MTQSATVGIAGLGAYAPPDVITSAQLSVETGVPEGVLRVKFGVDHLHRAGPDCHVSDMAAAAGLAALEDAGAQAENIDLVVYCGSEYKDYIVWSAATHIAGMLGCRRAEAYEVYALCAGTPIALRLVKDMMLAEPSIETALVVAASKESALVNRKNERTRFMFNFGDGAGAVVLRRGSDTNEILGSASLVDSSLSTATVMPGSGSRQPALEADHQDHYLDVQDLDFMRDRLDEVSEANFFCVASQALSRSGQSAVDVLIPVHVKRSMHERLQNDLNANKAFYLEGFGHMQAADQLVGLTEARRTGMLSGGEIVLLLAAGVGYTWSATVVRWGANGSHGA